MSLLIRRISIVSSVAVAGTSWAIIHHRNVRPVKDHLPPLFTRLTRRQPANNTTWGLYKRRLSRPVQFSDSTLVFRNKNTEELIVDNLATGAELITFIKALFACRMYQLEVFASNTNENPLDLQIIEGNKYGNLVIEQLFENQVVFNYEYPGFDFKLYLAIDPNDYREITLGFVEYTGQFDASLGQKVYSIMILESCARLLENSIIE